LIFEFILVNSTLKIGFYYFDIYYIFCLNFIKGGNKHASQKSKKGR